uniref:NADH-ubiquinone oxidoreductase chain 2 n=1 Tax=Haematopinus asini TaxID=1461129 RepID=A0A059T3X3_9NEOP|nr:NADH dehydrogenase subunit 2 [Haematopinus asini]
MRFEDILKICIVITWKSLILTMFVVLMGWGAVMTLGSWSWWGAWFGMELTSFFFIPFLGYGKLGSLGFNLWEYFMIQSVGSGVYILGMVLHPQSSLMLLSFDSFLNFVSMLGVLLKLGMPPFHWWSLLLVDLLNWKEFFVFSSLLKIPPVVVMLNLCALDVLFVILLMFVVLLVVVQGAVEASLRRFVAYSSMVNLMWVMLGGLVSFKSSLCFMVLYFLLLALFCAMMHMNSVSTVSSMCYSNLSDSKLDQMVFLFLMWSLMGFPPTLGFLFKLDILASLWEGVGVALASFVAFLSVVLLPIYMQFMYKVSLVSFFHLPTNRLGLHWSNYLLVILISTTFFFLI